MNKTFLGLSIGQFIMLRLNSGFVWHGEVVDFDQQSITLKVKPHGFKEPVSRRYLFKSINRIEPTSKGVLD